MSTLDRWMRILSAIKNFELSFLFYHVRFTVLDAQELLLIYYMQQNRLLQRRYNENATKILSTRFHHNGEGKR